MLLLLSILIHVICLWEASVECGAATIQHECKLIWNRCLENNKPLECSSISALYNEAQKSNNQWPCQRIQKVRRSTISASVIFITYNIIMMCRLFNWKHTSPRRSISHSTENCLISFSSIAIFLFFSFCACSTCETKFVEHVFFFCCCCCSRCLALGETHFANFTNYTSYIFLSHDGNHYCILWIIINSSLKRASTLCSRTKMVYEAIENKHQTKCTRMPLLLTVSFCDVENPIFPHEIRAKQK